MVWSAPAPIVKPDRESRAGAVLIRKRKPFDVEAVCELTAAVEHLAESHAVSTEYDSVEVSRVEGSYGWQGYLLDEMAEAKRRADARAKEMPARPKGPTVSKTPPSIFYA